MSDESQDQDDKTEEPTHKRLEDALKKGQVAFSKEVTTFILILLLTLNVIWILPYILKLTTKKLNFFIMHAHDIKISAYSVGFVFTNLINKMLLYMSPILLIAIISALVSSYFQYGAFIFSGESLKPNLSKLSIVAGFKRLFSMKNFVEFLKNIAKVIFIGIFVVITIAADIREMTQYQELSILGILGQLHTMVVHILILVTIIVAVIAMIDFSFQKYQHYLKLKMTRKEIKDEMKDTEGNPEVKQKLRSLRRKRLKENIQNAVPQATVVITNPEHYAIALQYDDTKDIPPICVAKGVDFMAQNIKALARENSVEIVESPELARALYKDVDINQSIPPQHFAAVAKIISYVMHLEQERKNRKKQV